MFDEAWFCHAKFHPLYLLPIFNLMLISFFVFYFIVLLMSVVHLSCNDRYKERYGMCVLEPHLQESHKIPVYSTQSTHKLLAALSQVCPPLLCFSSHSTPAACTPYRSIRPSRCSSLPPLSLFPLCLVFLFLPPILCLLVVSFWSNWCYQGLHGARGRQEAQPRPLQRVVHDAHLYLSPVSYYITLYYIILHYITLYYIILHYITLYFIILHHIALY